MSVSTPWHVIDNTCSKTAVGSETWESSKSRIVARCRELLDPNRFLTSSINLSQDVIRAEESEKQSHPVLMTDGWLSKRQDLEIDQIGLQQDALSTMEQPHSIEGEKHLDSLYSQFSELDQHIDERAQTERGRWESDKTAV